MKIMLDCSPKKLKEQSEKFNEEFWQLRTPLTKYKLAGVPYGLDNGCFTAFYKERWEKLLKDAQENNPVFVCLPDIVGDARRTLELFKHFYHKTGGLPRCLVLQDGIGNFEIPWFDIQAVFVGGSDKFKVSDEAMNAVKCAKMLGKWVHIGRVNTPERVYHWAQFADSIDGSAISKYDHMLEGVVKAIREVNTKVEKVIDPFEGDQP